MKIRIEPYKTWSGGAKALGERAGILRATRRQVEKHGDFTHVINWGRNERRFKGEYINNPEAVRAATNKLDAAKLFDDAGVPQPPFTEDQSVATNWLEAGKSVVARTMLRASSGRGIVLCTPENDRELPKAPLYTEYLKKADEFRLHVFRDKVIDVQQKRKRREVPNEEVNYQIRNAHNGWVFCRDDVDCPSAVRDISIAAVAALGLDFGAVDVGWNRKNGSGFVFECNTAPGLEGSTVEAYYRAIKEAFPAIKGGMYRRRRDSRRTNRGEK